MTTVKTQEGPSHGKECPTNATLTQYLTGSGVEIGSTTIPPEVQLELLKHAIELAVPHLKHLGLKPFKEICPRFFKTRDRRYSIQSNEICITDEIRMVALLTERIRSLTLTGHEVSLKTFIDREFFLCEDGFIAMVTITSEAVNHIVNSSPILAVVGKATDQDILEHIIHWRLLPDVLKELSHLTVLARNRAQCRAEELFLLHCSIGALLGRSGADLLNKQ